MERDLLDLSRRRLELMLGQHGRGAAGPSGELVPGSDFPGEAFEELTRIDAGIRRLSEAQRALIEQPAR
jgi:hypothetical protein